MSPWVAVIRALPVTFVVYASSTALAALHALPVALEVERLPSFAPGNESARIAALEALLNSMPVLRSQALSWLLAALAYALLSPWLQMSWLAALSMPRSPAAALSEGARLSPRAFLSFMWVGIGTLALLLPCAALVWATRTWLESRANVRVQDLATLLSLIPALVVLWMSLAWLDLARARCLSTGALRSSLRSFGDVLKPLALANYLGWSSLGLTLSILAQWLTLDLALRGFAGFITTLALVQGAALLRSVLRSRWLTETLLYADAHAQKTHSRKRSA